MRHCYNVIALCEIIKYIHITMLLNLLAIVNNNRFMKFSIWVWNAFDQTNKIRYSYLQRWLILKYVSLLQSSNFWYVKHTIENGIVTIGSQHYILCIHLTFWIIWITDSCLQCCKLLCHVTNKIIQSCCNDILFVNISSHISYNMNYPLKEKK